MLGWAAPAARPLPDAGDPTDSGPLPDAGDPADAGPPDDAAPPDAGNPTDAGLTSSKGTGGLVCSQTGDLGGGRTYCVSKIQGVELRLADAAPTESGPVSLAIYVHGDGAAAYKSNGAIKALLPWADLRHVRVLAVLAPNGCAWWQKPTHDCASAVETGHARREHRGLRGRAQGDPRRYDINFDPTFYYGSSGGTIFLAGAFLPRYGSIYPGAYAMNCGGTPQKNPISPGTPTTRRPAARPGSGSPTVIRTSSRRTSTGAPSSTAPSASRWTRRSSPARTTAPSTATAAPRRSGASSSGSELQIPPVTGTGTDCGLAALTTGHFTVVVAVPAEALPPPCTRGRGCSSRRRRLRRRPWPGRGYRCCRRRSRSGRRPWRSRRRGTRG